MNKNFINPKFWALTLMILAAAFTRLIPHYPNFTAVGAMALFGGAYFSKKYLAFVVPLFALFISDLFIGFYSGMWVVYLSFALIVVIGMQIEQTKNPGRVLLASVTSSVSFFLITNFALFPPNTLYPQNFVGIMESYTAAIPFFSYTLLGDLFFVGIMFGAYEIAKAKIPALAKAEI
ncbi:MAG TPA: DUF6580 family putative transport protein [Ignavibacteriaceae bacterium]|nr:DUF6580 family putative transport protein [Ignavibacteriaceae bacterium]